MNTEVNALFLFTSAWAVLVYPVASYLPQHMVMYPLSMCEALSSLSQFSSVAQSTPASLQIRIDSEHFCFKFPQPLPNPSCL